MPLRAPRGFIPEDDHRVARIGHPAPPWLVNYADLMTEMVAFFVILYALGAALNKNVQSAIKDAEEIMKEQKIEGKVEAVKEEGIKITMQEGGEKSEAIPFFESGSAELTERIIDVLNRMAPRLKKLAEENYEIIVEGHTDNVPIAGRYASNWELSTARATNVLRYMKDQLGFPPQRMGAVGYGEYRPVAPNDSEENRRKNRRVVFFVKSPSQVFKPETVKSLTD